MKTTKTVPPAYVAYRAVLIVVVLVLLGLTALVTIGGFTAWWQELLAWAGGLRQAWTDLHWSVV